jgi:hypothetical protein
MSSDSKAMRYPGISNERRFTLKRYLIAIALASATIATNALATDVGVSVTVGQPGFYGRIDIGGFPQPLVIYPQPTIITPVPARRPPIYLHVPPGHAKHWSKHCHQYNACGERVYFVQDQWYNHEYVPRYQEQHREHRDNEQGGHGDDHHGGHGHDDHDNGGHGKNHGHGHDR